MRDRSVCKAMWRVVLLLVAGGLAGSARAQAPDLNMLALDWARGRYATPLVCLFDGEPVRGMRRILVTPGSRNVRPPAGRLLLVAMEVDDAERCFTAFEGSADNLKGSLQIRLPAISRTDTAQHDFQTALRRDHGFTFDVIAGQIEATPVGTAGGEPRTIDFRGGTATLRMVAPGSDAERLLDEFSSPRKLTLELKTSSGEELRFHMLQSDLR